MIGTKADLVARYREGNPQDPIGIGSLCVEIDADLRVTLTHECRGTIRRWGARAATALSPALAAALSSAGFPSRPSQQTAAPGSSSFELMARGPDGAVATVTGFDSPEYNEIGRFFSALVAQVSDDPTLAFSMPGTAAYVVDAERLA